MKRLVYTPSVHAWVKTDTGVFDLSPYITEFNVDRRINEVSYAEITFRNPKKSDGRFMFTQHTGADGNVRPMFHPMDPIIITLTRLKGRPVQVFTGYCDTVPYVQLQPGLARLTASCTIKRLMYTFWDPALPFVRDFMAQNGWGISPNGTAINASAEGASQIVTDNNTTELVSGELNDTSIGKLLYRILVDIGGWDPGNVLIQKLPGDKISQLVVNLYKETVEEQASSIDQFHTFLKKVIGAGAYGKAGAVVTGPDGKPLIAPSTQDISTYEMMIKSNRGPMSNKEIAKMKKLPLPAQPPTLNTEQYNRVKDYLTLRDYYTAPLDKEAYGDVSKWKRGFDPRDNTGLGTGVFIPVDTGFWSGQAADQYGSVQTIAPGKIVKVGSLPTSFVGNNTQKAIVQELDRPIKVNGKSYKYIYYANLGETFNNIQTGMSVTQGKPLGYMSKNGSFGSGLYIGIAEDASGSHETSKNAQALYEAMSAFLQSANFNPGEGPTGFPSNKAVINPYPLDPGLVGYPLPAPYDNNERYTTQQTATAAAFSSYFSMPGLMEMSEAVALTGKRSLLNDVPLLGFVEQVAAGSLRSFMSLPNGDFYAFYPDYFGGLGRTAYWQIKDIEIIRGGIELSDDSLATHVFVVGDTQPSGGELGFGTIDWIDKINTAGVVNVLNGFAADFINGPPDPTSRANNFATAGNSLSDKGNAINFLKKYGARPLVEEMPAVRSPIYETFVAYQRFCLAWSEQFKTNFEFTFMPELYPGGIVSFPDHGLQCFVKSVTHSGSYESGFRTNAVLVAPSALKDGSGNATDQDRSWVHDGMIRAFATNPDTIAHPLNAYDSPANDPKPRRGG